MVQALKKSIAVFGRHKKQTVLAVILCNLAITAGVMGVYYLLMFGAAVMVSLVKDAHFAMATLFSLNDMIRVCTGFLSGLLGIVLNMYDDHGALCKVDASPDGRLPDAGAPGKWGGSARGSLFFL